MNELLPPLIKPNDTLSSPIRLGLTSQSSSPFSSLSSSPTKTSNARSRSEKLRRSSSAIDTIQFQSQKQDLRKSILLSSSADISSITKNLNLPPSCLDDILLKLKKDGYKISNKNHLQSKLMTGLFLDGCDCEEIAAGLLETSNDVRHVFEQPNNKNNNGLGTEATREKGLNSNDSLYKKIPILIEPIKNIKNKDNNNFKSINNQYSKASMTTEELKQHAAYVNVTGKKLLYKKYKDMNNERLIFSGTEASILSDMNQDDLSLTESGTINGNSISSNNTKNYLAKEESDFLGVIDDEVVSTYSSRYYSTSRPNGFHLPGLPTNEHEGEDNISVLSSTSTMLKSPKRYPPVLIETSMISNDSMSLQDASIDSSWNVLGSSSSPKSSSKKYRVHSPIDTLSLAETKVSYVSNAECDSPRTIFLGGCIRNGLTPFSNLILRKDLTKSINISHYSMGDTYASVLSECLSLLPLLESINIADNNLTDASIPSLVKSIMAIPSLKDLNMSKNKIDSATTRELAEYLGRSDCPLMRLVLSEADIDDSECFDFVRKLLSNKTLVELDLSYNTIGAINSKITKKASKSGAKTATASESISAFLLSSTCRLSCLNLSWNSIKDDSANKLAKTLSVNTSLTYLDLSFNGFGNAAGEILGDSIMDNKTIKSLVISSNSIGSTGCFTICAGVIENLVMKKLDLSGNPIGEIGAKAALQIPVYCSDRVELVASNCNITVRDPTCTFNFSNPCQNYKLRLNKPFERAVAFTVLQICASHPSYILKNVSYESAVEGTRSTEKLNLVSSVSRDKEQYYNHDDRQRLVGLRRLKAAASNTDEARRLFLESDIDGSGFLEKDEILLVFEGLGLQMDESKLHEVFAVFDIDGAGVINYDEFIELLKTQANDATTKIKAMTEYPIMALSSSLQKKYIPPKTGTLSFNLVDGLVIKENHQIVSSTDQEKVTKMARQIGDVSLIHSTLSNSRVHFSEAFEQYRQLYSNSGNIAEALAKIIPTMASYVEAKQLIYQASHGSKKIINNFKKQLGFLLKPILSAINGYYCLNLGRDVDRMTMNRLLQASHIFNQAKAQRSSFMVGYGIVGDTSQSGNWSCFRNCFFNNERIDINSETFTPIPKKGIIQFDFSGSIRPEGTALVPSDERVINVLKNLNLIITDDQEEEAMSKLKIWKAAALDVGFSLFDCDAEKAREVGDYKDLFYDNISERFNAYEEAYKKEEIIVKPPPVRRESISINVSGKCSAINSPTNSPMMSAESSPVAASRKSLASIQLRPSTNSPIKSPMISSPLQGSFILSPESLTARSQTSVETYKDDEGLLKGGTDVQQKIWEQKHRLILLTKSINISDNAKGIRYAELIEESFGSVWIRSRHLALIISFFNYGKLQRTEYFGSYNVDIVCALFGRIIDIYNFDIVLSCLDSKEYACVICRLGLLNIFNPLKTEGCLEINLARKEERSVAKMLLAISKNEPGILQSQSFIWKKEKSLSIIDQSEELLEVDESEVTTDVNTNNDAVENAEDIIMPIKLPFTPSEDEPYEIKEPFIITNEWYTDKGCPTQGVLSLSVVPSTKPDVLLRKAMLHLVLIDESNIIKEDDFIIEKKIVASSVIEHLKSELGRELWALYLCPNKAWNVDTRGNSRASTRPGSKNSSPKSSPGSPQSRKKLK